MSLPGLPKAGQQYAEAFERSGSIYLVDPYLLAAICDRESRFGEALTPPGPRGTGDNGHGRGLMQIDDRTWTSFCESIEWQDPDRNIQMGAVILKHNLLTFDWDEFLAVAAYNCGAGTVRKALKTCGKLPVEQRNHIVDSYTTGRNYSTDVLSRRDLFGKPEVTTTT